MEKRNKILAASFVFLCLLSVVMMLFQNSTSYSQVDASLFKVEELGKIDQVVLRNGAKKTELQFIDSRWKVNGAYEADKRLIKVFFATIDQVVPRREVSVNKLDSLSKEAVQVDLMENGTTVKSFSVKSDKGKNQTYFVSDDGKAYQMTIPGYRVFVAGIFEAGEGMWRDKRVFNFNWANFKDMEATFPSTPADNFHMVFKQKFFGIDGVTQIDTAKVNDYLDAVSLLEASEFLSGDATLRFDSLLKTNPAFEIKVNDIASRSYSLRIYPPQSSTTQILGKNEKDEVMIFDRQVIAPIAKKKSFFIGR